MSLCESCCPYCAEQKGNLSWSRAWPESFEVISLGKEIISFVCACSEKMPHQRNGSHQAIHIVITLHKRVHVFYSWKWGEGIKIRRTYYKHKLAHLMGCSKFGARLNGFGGPLQTCDFISSVKWDFCKERGTAKKNQSNHFLC